MKKKMIKRGLFGFPVGITIGFVITVIISACVGDGNFYPVTPELVGTMGSELNAVILQTVLCGVMGAGFAAASAFACGRQAAKKRGPPAELPVALRQERPAIPSYRSF